MTDIRYTRNDEEYARLRRYREAWEAYYGDYPLPLVIRPRPGRSAIDDNIALGWASEIVDTGVAYLFGDDLRFDVVDPLNPGTPSPDVMAAQQWLDRVWAANRKMTTLQKLAINGGVCGHAFIRIRPTVTAPGTAYRAMPDALRLQVLDPANVEVSWDMEDIERPTEYEIEWLAEDEDDETYLRRLRIVLDETGPAPVWLMVDERSLTTSETWVVVAESVWPFPWAPVVDCQNLAIPNEYYGQADLDPVIVRLIKAGVARASDLARTHRLHAHPQPYGVGMTPAQASQISLGIDQLAVLPSPDAKLAMLEIGGSASTSLEFVGWLKEQVREYARIPEVATGKLANIGSLSGVALSILFQPLLAKTETKRRTYGELLDDLNRRLLTLAGWDTYDVRIRWPEMLPGDPKAEADTAIVKQALGVSTPTLLAELGYDPAQEQAQTAAAAEAAVTNLLAGGPASGM